MVKTYTCRDVGVDCDWAASSETEEGLMAIIAEHAENVQGMTEIAPELLAQVKAAIKDE